MDLKLTSPSAVAVLTWLDPTDRPRVDAAGSGIYRAVHHDSLDALRREVRRVNPAASRTSTSVRIPQLPRLSTACGVA